MGIFKHIINSIVGMALTIFVGTIGFQYFEGINLFDSFWLTVITLLTVGYGDIIPQTPSGKVFALIIIPIGIAWVTYGLGAVAAVTIEGVGSRSQLAKFELASKG